MKFSLQIQNTPEELTGLDYGALFIFWAIVFLLSLVLLNWIIKRKNKK